MYPARPRILSVGTAVPPNKYTQQDVISRYRVQNPTIQNIFKASHIKTRHLYLPPADPNGIPNESQSELLKKHRKGAMDIGFQAIEACLKPLGLRPRDIDMLCCISSTGFMLPGLTAMFIKHFGFRTDCHRMDLVGMGCNAGLNGLNPASSWAQANPSKLCLMVCCEINSALYVFDEKIGTGVVNSLFGDGCAAVLLRADAKDQKRLAPEIIHFSSHIIPDTWRAMSYHWKDEHNKFSFYLDRDVPYVLGSHADKPIKKLLDSLDLKVRDISHWIVHSGGKKVIDAIKYTVGLTAHDMRHTIAILQNYGNLGSGSFLFSYQRLLKEGLVHRGDYGVMMTMGPGSTIETALLRW
ncbi:MAG: 3,5-dihydroxyphenylacetyl-CoA synthase DpgA [Myxococcota bacterium]|nr:3,5-dihydroxyphenylacetyl-CoA synthase DpgA [Myxococcota bacterium]